MPTGSTPSGVATPATVSYGDSGFLENPYGKEVPEAVRWVVSAGATLKELSGFSSSLRLRYFGPRPLTSDAIYTSPSTTLVNFEASYKFNKSWSLVGEVLNVFNRRDHDVGLRLRIANCASLRAGVAGAESADNSHQQH